MSNLFIVLIVNSMQTLNSEAAEEIHEEAAIAHDEREILSLQTEELAREIRRLRDQMTSKDWLDAGPIRVR